MKLNELKVIVTGGASGMGRHFAERLHGAGASVAVGDVNEAGLASLPDGIHRRLLDVGSEESIVEFVPWAAEAMGGLSGLINNAGILRDGLLVKRSRRTGEIVKMTREQLQAVLDVNLTGAILMTREVAGHMIEAEQPGVIVNISSIARHGSRGQTNYVAAKSALAANTVTWMRELAPYSIRVGAVAPGMVETPMTAGMRQDAREKLISGIPLGRIGTPEDIWHAVRFIFECEYFSGRTIDVDGGGGMG